jgi:hypothetical protein
MPFRERIYLGRTSGLPKTEVTLRPEQAKPFRSIKRVHLPIRQYFLASVRPGLRQIGLSRRWTRRLINSFYPLLCSRGTRAASQRCTAIAVDDFMDDVG